MSLTCETHHGCVQGNARFWQLGVQIGGVSASPQTPRSALNLCITRRDLKRFFNGFNLQDKDIRRAWARMPRCLRIASWAAAWRKQLSVDQGLGLGSCPSGAHMTAVRRRWLRRPACLLCWVVKRQRLHCRASQLALHPSAGAPTAAHLAARLAPPLFATAWSQARAGTAGLRAHCP